MRSPLIVSEKDVDLFFVLPVYSLYTYHILPISSTDYTYVIRRFRFADFRIPLQFPPYKYLYYTESICIDKMYYPTEMLVVCRRVNRNKILPIDSTFILTKYFQFFGW